MPRHVLFWKAVALQYPAGLFRIKKQSLSAARVNRAVHHRRQRVPYTMTARDEEHSRAGGAAEGAAGGTLLSFTKGCKLLKVPGTGIPLADPASSVRCCLI